MHKRPVQFRLSGTATFTDSDMADLRDVLVEVVERFPGIDLLGFSTAGWAHDGTALDGDPPVAGRKTDPRIQQLLGKLAEGRPESPVDVLRARFETIIADVWGVTGLEFRVEDAAGGCFWLLAQWAGRHYILTEHPEVLTVASDPYGEVWGGWLLTVVADDDYHNGDIDMAVLFPENSTKGLTLPEVVATIERMKRL
jgi:hypothetical protein